MHTFAAGLLLTGVLAAPGTVPPTGCHHAPGYVRLTEADNGRRITVCRGIRVEVALQAPMSDTPDTWWKSPTAHGAALRAVPDPARTAVRGVTLGAFVADRHGTATLRSTRVACPINPSGPPCHPIRRWQATVQVS